jgi:hypothetical protein
LDPPPFFVISKESPIKKSRYENIVIKIAPLEPTYTIPASSNSTLAKSKVKERDRLLCNRHLQKEDSGSNAPLAGRHWAGCAKRLSSAGVLVGNLNYQMCAF